MSAGEPDRRVYRFGPVERRGIVGALRLGQVLVLGAGCIAAVVALRALPSSIGVLAALALVLGAGVLALAPISGRTPEQWLPIIAGTVAVRVRGEASYRSGRAAAGVTGHVDGSGQSGTPALPPPLRGCRLLSVELADGNALGMLHDPLLNAYTAVIVLRARAVSLLPESEHDRRLERWGQLLSSTARRSSAVRRVQVLERTAPADGEAIARYLGEARDPSVTDDDAALRSYEELSESATRVTQEHEVLLGVQLSARRAWARAARDGNYAPRGRDEQAGHVMIGELRALLGSLQRLDVHVVGLLEPAYFARTLRTAFDPFGGTPAGVDGALSADAIETRWTAMRADSAWHRTYWISHWPRLPVGPVFLTPLLLGTQAVRTVSIVFEPVPPDRSRRAVEAAVTSDEADELRREAKGFRRTAHRRRQQEATSRREEELASGHEEMRFAGYVTVSGKSRDELAIACEEIEQAAQQAWLGLTPCWGEQDVAFVQSALPIARGLRDSRALGGT